MEDLTRLEWRWQKTEDISDVLRGVWFVSLNGIYSLVFIVETDIMKQWSATRIGGAAMLGASVRLNMDLRHETAGSCQS